MSEVTVRWFAVLREQRGCEEEQVALLADETAAGLYERLVPTTPHGRMPVAFAQNHAYVPGSTVLVPGDVVAFLPPLGGG